MGANPAFRQNGEGARARPSERDLSVLARLLVTHEHSMSAEDAEAINRCYQYLQDERRRARTGYRRVIRALADQNTHPKETGDG